MRDLLVMAIVMLSLPLTLRRPFVGLLVFSWLAYMRPQDLCWGFARTLRLSFFVSIVMLFGWWANEQGKRRFTRWEPRTVMMMVLMVLIAISYAQAKLQDEYTNKYFFEYLKIVVVALFTVGQCDSKQRLRAMFWVIAISLGFFGVKSGLWGLVTGGGSQILRGPGGMLEDNNDFALALVMNIPLLWYMGLSAVDRPWLKKATRIAIVLTAITVLLTHSRGAFLAMTTSALVIAWRSGKLLRAGGALVVLGLLFPLLAPQSVLERLGTIGDTKESSTAARLNSWGTAFNMIRDNPVWGVGMRNFQPRYREYSIVPLPPEAKTYVAHNSYLQIWAESGTLAFVAYLAILASIFLTCWRLQRISRRRPDLWWVGNYARMMEVTTVAFMVGAFFLNRGHFDLIYHWIVLVTALAALGLHAAYRQQEPAAVPARGGRGHRIAVRWRDDAALVGAGARAAPQWRRRG